MATIFEEVQPTNGPEIGKPFVLIHDPDSSEDVAVPESVTTVFGPLNDRNVIHTTVDRLVADIPHLSTRQVNDFVFGKPIIAMLVPMPIEFDLDMFKRKWREHEQVLRKALAVNVVTSVQRLVGFAGDCDHAPVLQELAKAVWTPRVNRGEKEPPASVRQHSLEKLYGEGLDAISTWYPGQPSFDDIKAALNVEGARLTNSSKSRGGAFLVAQFEIVATFFRLYRRAQNVTDLLDQADAAKAEGRKGIYGVFNRLLQPPFTKRDLIVAAYNGDFDPTELSPRHLFCRREFEETRKLGQQHRAAVLSGSDQFETD